MKAWLFWIGFTLCCALLLPVVVLSGRWGQGTGGVRGPLR